MIPCELCARDERLRFRYQTRSLYEEHMLLVHGIALDEAGRSVKDRPADPVELTESPVIRTPPRR